MSEKRAEQLLRRAKRKAKKAGKSVVSPEARVPNVRGKFTGTGNRCGHRKDAPLPYIPPPEHKPRPHPLVDLAAISVGEVSDLGAERERVLLRTSSGRIPIEESRRHEFEPRGRDRHDRPFLRARVMGHSHRVPDDHILSDERLVVRQPLREPTAHRVLVWVRSCRVCLLLALARHPDVVVHEPRALARRSIRRHVGDGIAAGDQLVSSEVADRVLRPTSTPTRS